MCLLSSFQGSHKVRVEGVGVKTEDETKEGRPDAWREPGNRAWKVCLAYSPGGAVPPVYFENRISIISAGLAFPSLQQNLHGGLQLLFCGRVSWRQVLDLHDSCMCLLKEVLSHLHLHTLAPCSQLGSAFEDLAASTDRLWGEGARWKG